MNRLEMENQLIYKSNLFIKMLLYVFFYGIDSFVAFDDVYTVFSKFMLKNKEVRIES